MNFWTHITWRTQANTPHMLLCDQGFSFVFVVCPPNCIWYTVFCYCVSNAGFMSLEHIRQHKATRMYMAVSPSIEAWGVSHVCNHEENWFSLPGQPLVANSSWAKCWSWEKHFLSFLDLFLWIFMSLICLENIKHFP